MVDKNTQTYSLFNGSPMVDVLHKLDEKISKLTDKEVLCGIEKNDPLFAYWVFFGDNPRRYFNFRLSEPFCRSEDIDSTLDYFAGRVIKEMKRYDQSNPSVSSAGT